MEKGGMEKGMEENGISFINSCLNNRTYPLYYFQSRRRGLGIDLVSSRRCTAGMSSKKFMNDHDGTSATITVADEAIEATFLHPFWVVHGDDLANRPIRGHLPRVLEGTTTPGRWVDAGDVRVGDELLLRDGEFCPFRRFGINSIATRL